MSGRDNWDGADPKYIGKVYVGGIGSDVTCSELEAEYSKYGSIKDVWIAHNPPGFGFVEFFDERDGRDAIRATDGARVCGYKVSVEASHGKKSKRKRYLEEVRCYNCNRWGHLAKVCTRGSGDYRRGSRSRSGSPRRQRSRSPHRRSLSRSPRRRSPSPRRRNRSGSRSPRRSRSPGRSRSARKSRSPRRSRSARKSRSPRRSRSARKSRSPRRSRSPRKRSRSPRRSRSRDKRTRSKSRSPHKKRSRSYSKSASPRRSRSRSGSRDAMIEDEV